MSSRRAERLVNLVICLLATRQYLPASKIRLAVPGYEPAGADPRGDEAFKRMFERDKADLRELGIPLETGRNSIFDAEDGYRIARRDYELPEISLEPDEAAAVGLAARLWHSAQLADAAHSALVKLRAAGVELEPEPSGLESRIDTGDAAFQPCLDAVRRRQAIRFDYRKPSQTDSQPREIEPWGVVSWRGRWYLVGHDRGRQAQRSFRLSRIRGAVRTVGEPGAVTAPEGLDLVGLVAGTECAEPPSRTALLAVRDGQAPGVRRIGRVIGHEPGVDLLEVDYRDTGWMAGWLAGFGTAVVVREPAPLRQAVIDRLTAVLRAQRAPAGDDVAEPAGGTAAGAPR